MNEVQKQNFEERRQRAIDLLSKTKSLRVLHEVDEMLAFVE